jgi:hypothetical protein
VLVMGVSLLTAAAPGVAVTAPSARVRLERAHMALYPGENVPVTVVNDGPSPVFRGDCFVLERWTGRGWRPITHTHGAPVGCPSWAGVVQQARTRQLVQIPLWDDLRPGSYRVTLYYRPVGEHWRMLRRLSRRDLMLRMFLTVGRAPRRRQPRLTERRILAIAESAAGAAGDAAPSLIQHAAGPRLAATLVASGDLVFDWNWSYLIAIRGHFMFTNVPGPSSASATISGSVITLVVDAATGRVTDSGISNAYPHLARLGKVTTDLHR